MGRRKRIIRLSDNMIERIQNYLDANATIAECNKRYINPDNADLFDSIHNSAYSIVEALGRTLNLKGKPDLKQIEEDYDYYNDMGLVKPEYKKDNAQ